MLKMRWCCSELVDLLFTVLIWSAVAAEAPDSSSICGKPKEQFSAQSHDTSVGRKRVVGGSPTTTRAFPWTVLIKQYGQSGVVCTGAVLSSRLVLTAAHCFDNVNQREIYLWVGKDQMDYYSSYQRVYLVQDVSVHDTYNRTTKKNDIALIQTGDVMHFNSNVRPVCLSDNRTTTLLPSLAHCYLAGYGDTQGTGADRRLNYMQVPLVDPSLCAQDDWLGTHFQAVSDVSFCAGYADGGPDACAGDSGAALVCLHPTDNNFYVYGVASWGMACGERGKPGVYTRVPAFLDWITAHLQALPS